ncbi:GNAT family N-acetyltransferase [Ammoniphilus resinae]|uniref:Ribosomal protein S18 acetylase RimI-like enzyme n=1 Tax=Ammoniphilus resinae TaxID=861532 RepID=A0ABS4GRG0_9BACL|nr:GNAT family N-acetyltransferase [Ammoniphilus resinae]MBP1932858.1 ribosomal protein S18 acetylase RimI-like enzyme [Ammoniphilus resinae]
MNKNWRIRRRIPELDDLYLLTLIKENLGHYPSSYGLTDEKIIDLLNKYTEVFLLMSKAGSRVGFLAWTEKAKVMLLELCVLEPRYQGKGIATYFMKKVESRARRGGFSSIRFYVDRNNERAQRLYQRFGYTVKRINWLTHTILMEKRM